MSEAPSAPEVPDEPVVRQARLEDVEALADLVTEGRGGDPAPYAAAFAKIASDARQVLAVAELGGQVVGTAQLSLIPTLADRGAMRVQIDGVATLPTMRGRGIGEALFAWALDEARRHGASTVFIASEVERGNAHRFYEHLGFTATHRGFTATL